MTTTTKTQAQEKTLPIGYLTYLPFKGLAQLSAIMLG